MNSENIKKVTNQAIERLITALNEGRSETLTRDALPAIGRFHRYSLEKRNANRITEADCIARSGLSRWHRLGRFVKKGEKGIVILAPIVRRKNESAKQHETDESSTASDFARPTSLTSANGRPRTSDNQQCQRRASRVP